MTQADKNVEDDAIVNLGPKENVDKAIVTMGPKENVLKHSLQTAWTVWHYNNDRSQDWDKNLREVVSFDTIEDFWAVINHIQKPSGLKHGCDYMLFRKGIKPMWEDKANMYGGRWLFGIDDKRYTDRNGRIEKLDIAWLEVMMCLIGEAFGESGNYVNGAVCQRRKMKSNKLALWLSTSNVSDESSIIYPIGTVVKQRCASDLQLVFEDHYAFASRKGSRNRKVEPRLEIK